MTASFENFILKLFILVLALYSIVEIKKKKKYGLLANSLVTYFKDRKNMAVKENFRITINHYKIQSLPVIT